MISYFHSQLTGKSTPEQAGKFAANVWWPFRSADRIACDDSCRRSDPQEWWRPSMFGTLMVTGPTMFAKDSPSDVPARYDRLGKVVDLSLRLISSFLHRAVCCCDYKTSILFDHFLWENDISRPILSHSSIMLYLCNLNPSKIIKGLLLKVLDRVLQLPFVNGEQQLSCTT